MNSLPSDGTFGARELSALRGVVPRALADAFHKLMGRHRDAEPPAPGQEIVMLFDSPAAADRACGLIERLQYSSGVKQKIAAWLVSFRASVEAPGAEITDAQTCGGTPAPSADISDEMRGWFAEWLQARHLQQGYALILPLDAAHPDPHMLEEAKLSAAVCHGLVRTFELAPAAA